MLMSEDNDKKNKVNSLTNLFHTLILNTAIRYPNKNIFHMRKSGVWKTWQFSSVIEEVKIYADTLRRIGIRSGDRVIILAENLPQTVITFLSILHIQATAVLLDPSLPIQDLQRLIIQADARAITVTEKYLHLFKQMSPIDLPILNIELSLHHCENYASYISKEFQDTVDPDPNIAIILFTSGTAGTFKGVKLTHQSIIDNIKIVIPITRTTSNDSFLSLLPIYHVFPLCMQIIAALHVGGEIAFIDSLDSNTLLASLKEFKPTVLILVPRILELLKQNIEKQLKKKSSLIRWFGKMTRLTNRKIRNTFGGRVRIIICGGAKLQPKVEKAFKNFGFNIIQGYGLTETGGFASVNRLENNKIGTVGYPPPEIQIKINQPDEYDEGEICFKGPNLMSGYFRNEEATQNALKDGWFYTGDIGKIDKDGFLTIIGRLKDIIVTSTGKKVSYQFIESHYQGIDGVEELAVVSMLSKNKREEIHAAIKINKDYVSNYSIDQIKKTIMHKIDEKAAGLASYLQIQYIHFIDELPKTNTMKVKLFEIKKLILTTTALTTEKEITPYDKEKIVFKSLKQQKIAEDLQNKLAQLLNISSHDIILNEPLFHYGVDSLVFMDLHHHISSQFSQLNDMGIYNRYPSIFSLSEYLSQLQNSIADKITYPQKIGADPIAGKPPQKRSMIKIFMRISKWLWELEGSSIENISPSSSYIFCANHESHFDPFWIMSVLPDSMIDQISILAKKEHWNSRFSRKIAQYFGAIPVDRFGNINNAYTASKQLLMQGRSLLIFPEGTRTKTGQLGEFKNGPAKLAQETGIPLLPVAIKGAYAIYPSHNRLPNIFNIKEMRRYKIKIIFGKPLFPSDSSLYSQKKLTLELRDEIYRLNTSI